MTKKSKFNYLNGLEITTQLSFNDWKPGFEYTKNIGIKNLNTRSVKLIYKIPRTKNFTTLLPKINSLSPGTSLTIPITFRPLEKVEYNDSIEVEILDFQKSVKIPLIAKLPQYKIAISDSLNLGPCSVYESVSSSLRLTNLSDMETSFEIDIKEPFNVSVLNGEIEPKSSIELSFFFSPKSALVCEASAIIKYGSAENLNLFKKVNLYGIGKYPHILVQADDKTSSEIELQFENVLIGQNLTKFFTIINMTEVQTDFFIEKEIELTPFDRAFNCSQHIGTLLPYEKQKIAITYSPNYPSSDNVFSYLNVYSSGKLSKNRITCFASNKLPEVFLDKNLLNFGTVKTGEKNYKTFHIKNNCSCVLNFQFDNDNEFGSFKINVTNGTLQPNETKLIQVAFVPQNAAIYYKKVPCLVQNHEILFIEFIGTCHSELMKPPEIERKNLNLFYYLKSNKLLRNSPEGLIELMEQKKIFNDTTLEEVFKSNDFSLVTNSYEEYTNDDIHSFRDKYQKSIETCVTTDTHYVDFGYAQTNNLDESYEKSITFTNHTRGKLIVCWNSNEERPFSIFPPICEIPALKTYSFRVKFLPKSVDKFYNNKLEAYAFFKSLSDYNVADQRFILPSWCLNLNCIGHTFHPSSETFFPPRYSLDTDSIIFPAGVRDQELFRTFLLKNANPNCPLIFDFQKNDTNPWSIKPHKGLIKTNEHQIFVIKYVPRTDQLNFEKCHFLLNYTPNFMVSVGILGGGTLPELSLENNGLLYFPPTCRNNSTTCEYELVNLTHSKIGYEWKIPYESKNLFSVDQVECILNPHERKKSLWTFSPNKIDKYNHKVGLVAWIDGHRQTLKSYSVRMLGSCTHGSLQVADMYKDFGSVIIGSSVSNEIVVMNNNDCRLDFELYVRQSTDDAIGNKSNDNICVLELEQSMGHVEARSKRTVRCRFRPVRLVNYQFTIEYRIIYPNESSEFLKAESDTPKSMKEILCYMTANGVYPKMAIKDIKGLGSVSNISKDYLWKLISVNE
ncbi:coiled-coil domain-containing protein [Brachionus plicatilis]|uniref:Coiled-coil domain-containing protein n=1 Tax=Brachionus plicatilis TaxID=10195 RepID=A0A3M7RZG3_BRAPC|nr:coiled-coil domain-containing protein [Brachionus plicatilis]